jgi:hypothetical protein
VKTSCYSISSRISIWREIAAPMTQNGYFDEEALVAMPVGASKNLLPAPRLACSEISRLWDRAEFMAVEGNRRLSYAHLSSRRCRPNSFVEFSADFS